MTDVVVVGAGPVGMTAAALLAARDVRVAVLEARETTSADPKAISIDDDLERALAATLDANPRVDLRFGARVTGLAQRDGRVDVRVATAAGEREVSARYVIGADGGRSAVRDLLGITMSGRAYDEPWLVAGTLGDPHRELYGLHFGVAERPTVIIPGKDGRCRYEFLLFPGEGLPGETPRHDLIVKLLAPHRAIAPDQAERAVIYKFNGLATDEGRAYFEEMRYRPPLAFTEGLVLPGGDTGGGTPSTFRMLSGAAEADPEVVFA